MILRNVLTFQLLTPRPNPELQNPLVDCPRLLIQYPCSYPPHLKALMIRLINIGKKIGLIPREEHGLRVLREKDVVGDAWKQQKTE